MSRGYRCILVICLGGWLSLQSVLPRHTGHTLWEEYFHSMMEMVTASTAVVVAEVAVVQATDEIGGLPFTNFGVTIREVIRGSNLPGQILVRQTGDEKVQLQDDPLMKVGQTYVLFLRADRQDKPWFWVVGGPQGRFQVIGGRLMAVQGIGADTGPVGLNPNLFPVQAQLHNKSLDSLRMTLR